MSLTKFLNRSLVESTKIPKRICILKPMEAKHQSIHLAAGHNVIGRSKETGIRDIRCSKQQLQLDVDLDKCSIRMKVLGLNPCGVNGLMSLRGTQCDLEHCDVIEIVYGCYQYEILFKPPPELEQKSDIQAEITPSQLMPIDGANEKASIEYGWDSVDNGKLVIFTSKGVISSEKIAAYDMDGTIIKTKSGNVFPKNKDDWQIIFPEVPTKLKRLHEEHYKICFFTNQAGIAKGNTNLNDFKNKIEAILHKLNIPVQVFISTGDGYYRKPIPGMWKYLETKKNDGIFIRKENSFFVGDAAGRPASGAGPTKRKKDHSCADRLFAINIGLSFNTPEEHFLGRKPSDWVQPDFDPKCIKSPLPLIYPEDVKIPSAECEVIVLVGLPGSGKSHFARTHLEPLGYVVLNSDTLGSVKACLSWCEKHLLSGRSAVIDNTNVDVASRKKFIDLTRRFKVRCRCFVINTSLAQIKHNIAYRQLTDETHTKINDMLMNMMKKKYVEPIVEEGFAEIAKVNLMIRFANAKDEELYKLYLVEK